MRTKKEEKDWGYSSVVEYLPSMGEALDSVPSTKNQTEKKKKRGAGDGGSGEVGRRR